MRVSTAEFISRVGELSDSAEREPVTITADGRDRLVLVSANEYARLIGHDRGDSSGRQAAAAKDDISDLWGALRGTMSWDKDSDITEPVGEIWNAER